MISKKSCKDFVLPHYLELSERVGEVTLLMEVPREQRLVKQRTWGGSMVALVVAT